MEELGETGIKIIHVGLLLIGLLIFTKLSIDSVILGAIVLYLINKQIEIYD